MFTTFTTDRVDPAERFESRVLEPRDVLLSMLSFPSVRVQRPEVLIRRSAPEAYQVNLVLDGRAVVAQHGRQAVLEPGDFSVCDTSKPMRGRRVATTGARLALVQVPKARVPLPESGLRALIAVPFDTRSGVGGVFARWVVDALDRAEEFTPADAGVLASVTTDLLTAVLAERLGEARPEDDAGMRRRVHDFIDQELGDPSLTPASVARAHHISLRRLQRLFAEQDTGPAGFIRSRRLERCRRDLADPRAATTPVHTIGTRWGFPDAAHFSRLFRSTFGHSPGEYRRLSRMSNGGAHFDKALIACSTRTWGQAAFAADKSRGEETW
ncbi:AraC-like DNA-binding protein [Actinokineospora baliensis]|uniref:helix-turn-helix domain-containing protein n=1 Tax=Actinokineospora baliensis TaxID=547056 RepID=UPI00195C2D4F|nr:helix-turn-helix domain-containing protein [Actinokineospora baliensis]MBM7774683.1 AraC-like DNA-binding protein [Actinokineospora baliensis]